MASRLHLLTVGIFSTFILIFAGCGGSSNQLAGKPQGNYSNASLNGTYAMLLTGTNTSGSGVAFFAVAGSLQANGSGTITGGTIDINSPATSTLMTNTPVSGTYIIAADGRGSATINISGSGSFHLDLVVTSSSHVLITRFDGIATGSGSLDLQNSASFSLASISGNVAFDVSGINNTGNPEAAAGAMTFDGSGNISGGVEDVNEVGAVSNAAIISASNAVGTPNTTSGRGTATISTGAHTFTFAYYVVDSNHLKLLETDALPLLAGDAFRQSTTPISGTYVFADAGSSSVPYAAAGLLVTDGAGNIQSGSMEDVNNGGNTSQAIPLTGTYSAISGGRGTASINGNFGTANYAIYPTTGGILEIGIDSTSVTTGTAVSQQAGPFASASINGVYALNISGVNGSPIGEIDATAQLKSDGNGNLTGALDLNNGGILTSNLAVSGTYSIAANGRGLATLQTSAGVFNLAFYIGNSASIQFVELANNEVAVGIIQQQH